MTLVPNSRREHWILVAEIWLTIGVAAALFPVLLDLWAAEFTEVAARMEHGLALAAVWPVERARAAGLLPPPGSARFALGPALGGCAGLALLLTGIAALIDHRPGEKPGLLRRVFALPWIVTVGPPALVAALGLIFVGAALDPLLFVTLLVFGFTGGLLGRRRRRHVMDWERSLSGLPPAFWKTDHLVRFGLLFGGLAGIVAVAAVVGLPFDEAPLRLALAWDSGSGVTGPAAVPWIFGLVVVLLVLLAPHTRRALGLMTWEPWVAGAIGGVGGGLLLATLEGAAGGHAAMPLGFALGLLGALLAGAGVPWLPRLSPHPLRAVGRLGLPMAAAVGTVGYVLTTGFLGCDAVGEDPRVFFVTRQPGAIDVTYAGGRDPAVFAAFRADSHVIRLALDGRSTFVVEASALPLRQLEEPGAVARPIRLGNGANGRIFLLSEVRKEDAVSVALVELDPNDAGILAIAEDTGPCGPASFGWNPILSVGIVGCSDVSEVLLYEPNLGTFISREQLRGGREFQSLAIDPTNGSMIALARRKSPFLIRLDLTERRPVAWQFIGMSNLSLDLDELGVLRVARFLGRQVSSFDVETLQPTRSRPAGFALGPLEEAPLHDRVVTASLADGHLYAVDAVGREPTRRLHVGGWVQSLSLAEGDRTMYAAGLCGVMAIDLDAWLREDRD